MKNYTMAVKCWKTKSGNLAKALCYVDAKGRERVATFDKWFIGSLLGSMGKYYHLKEGDVVYFAVNEMSVDCDDLFPQE